MTTPNISVVIPTRDRAASLVETLGALRAADRDGLTIDIVVVSNGSRDDTTTVARSFTDDLTLRVLEAPTPGKAHALNRAIEEGGLGDLVAVLDDDMTPEPGWFRGVAAISARHPLHAFFTGRTPLRWPDAPREPWTEHSGLRGWAFSSVDGSRKDEPIRPGFWATGNHFWVRRCVFDAGQRFLPIWLTEPWFMLQLQEQGLNGIMAPDAVAWHRIQPELLSRQSVRDRAIRVGRGFAHVRLRCRRVARQGILLDTAPAVFRCLYFCLWIAWGVRYVRAACCLNPDTRFTGQIRALERMTNARTMLRIHRQVRDEWRTGVTAFPEGV